MAEQKPAIAGVRLLNVGRISYVDPGAMDLNVGDWVVVETSQGRAVGRVAIATRQILMNLNQGDRLPVERLLNDGEFATVESNQIGPSEETRLIGGLGRRERIGPELGHEHERYAQLKATMPRLGQRVETPRGPGVVVSLQVHNELASVRLDDNDQTLTFARPELEFTPTPS